MRPAEKESLEVDSIWDPSVVGSKNHRASSSSQSFGLNLEYLMVRMIE
jgi:hypothetical protein